MQGRELRIERRSLSFAGWGSECLREESSPTSGQGGIDKLQLRMGEERATSEAKSGKEDRKM